MNSEQFDPMAATTACGGGGVPPGPYTGEFTLAEYLPQVAADEMTGKGGRQYPAIRFRWVITEGEHAGKTVSADTTTARGPTSGYVRVASWLLSKPPAPGGMCDLRPCVGKKYLLTLGSRPGKSWIEVVNAMLLPNQ